MNYGEEYAYWYLRLNGFFCLPNFVIHRSGDVRDSSDCDILAIRPPHVFEEIGGKPDDWDHKLQEQLDFRRTIGVICEVKTGGYSTKELFKPEHVNYCLGRLGFVPPDHVAAVGVDLASRKTVEIAGNYQVCKLLIANGGVRNGDFLFCDLESVIHFLRARVAKYSKEKYRDRTFFSSVLFQSTIDLVSLNRDAETQMAERGGD